MPAYSTIYGHHPRFIATTAEGWKLCSSHACPWKSKSGLAMKARCAKDYNRDRKPIARSYRQNLLKILRDCRSRFVTHSQLVSLNACSSYVRESETEQENDLPSPTIDLTQQHTFSLRDRGAANKHTFDLSAGCRRTLFLFG